MNRDPLGVGAPWSGDHFSGTTVGRPSWHKHRLATALRIVVGGALVAGLIMLAMKAWVAAS